MRASAYKLHAFEAFPKSKRAAQKRQLFRQPLRSAKTDIINLYRCGAHGLSRTLR